MAQLEEISRPILGKTRMLGFRHRYGIMIFSEMILHRIY